MSDVTDLFERQERWQRSRARLSWSEKLRLAETLREAALAMRPPRAELTDGRQVRAHRAPTGAQET